MKKIFSNKNKLVIGGLLLALSTLISCKKLIEVPPNPPTQITRAEQFADSATTLSAVAGVYSYTYGAGVPYSDANFTITTSLSAHEILYAANNSGDDHGEFYSYTLTPLNNEVATLWQVPYQSLYQVNDVIAGVTGSSSLSPSFVKQITGEMEVTRAFYYFYMVNLFGGVPLVTSTDYNINAQLPRATATAVYTQIVTDLNDAEKKLSANYPAESSGHVRPNLYTAMALLSKVHLYKGQWQAAYNEADSVIKSGLFNLEPNLNNVFLDGSAEAIWQLPVENAYQGTADATTFLPSSAGVAPNYPVTDSLLSQFEPGDQRLTNWLDTVTVASKTVYYPYKYKDYFPTTPATDYMMIRLGEIYLIRAEAAAELNNLGGAMADVNTIRNRAGLGASTANAGSQASVLAAVAKERRTELCFEFGNRWFDLIRTGKAAAFLPGYQAYDALYPIPQSQIQLNSHLIQNPGYH